MEKKLNPRYEEYNQYLKNYIQGVIRSWEEILKPKMVDWFITETDVTVEDINKILDFISEKIKDHDLSKYDESEFCAYLNYFYPSAGFEADEDEFNKAWLIHQIKNSHHFQYWVLVGDDGSITPLNMPLEDICEMLCDWHSFSH